MCALGMMNSTKNYHPQETQFKQMCLTDLTKVSVMKTSQFSNGRRKELTFICQAHYM